MWLRTLFGLSALTGEKRYREQAEATITEAYQQLGTPEGLLYWGGHLAYDLERDQPWMVGKHGHEFKAHFPFYAGLATVQTERIRHCKKHFGFITSATGKPYYSIATPRSHDLEKRQIKRQPVANWDFPFDTNLDLPLTATKGDLSFSSAAISLIHAAFQHEAQTSSDELAQWGLRLAGRYWAMQHPETGLGGHQFNKRQQGKEGDKAEKHYGAKYLVLKRANGCYSDH